jgi:hypothetical protein
MNRRIVLALRCFHSPRRKRSRSVAAAAAQFVALPLWLRYLGHRQTMSISTT